MEPNPAAATPGPELLAQTVGDDCLLVDFVCDPQLRTIRIVVEGYILPAADRQRKQEVAVDLTGIFAVTLTTTAELWDDLDRPYDPAGHDTRGNEVWQFTATPTTAPFGNGPAWAVDFRSDGLTLTATVGTVHVAVAPRQARPGTTRGS